jgi:hypothetical protein
MTTRHPLRISGAAVAIAALAGPLAGQATTRTEHARSGVYVSAADYGAGRLTYEIDCRTAAHKIELNKFLSRSYIDVTHEGKRYRHNKWDVYAVQTCGGELIRFAGGKEYKLAEVGPLLIYTVPSYAGSTFDNRRIDTYCYSTSDEGDIRPLTRESLRAAFRDREPVLQLLDQTFTTGEQLSEFDRMHQMYKVNHLLGTVSG